ncbi:MULTISPECIES: DUF421 domain-containing protein [unclassified Paenibacillus]|uniref:DUF421 domain-containing protein n=1 Tax=Paenibacillus TaxID=44249 RepID=UPI000CFB1C09|nr:MULTISPECIES: DUF421 domain-containing protein [unclassified Paenibacillus]MDQ0655876.1 uncharacterized membrane protein YcaP (DUF421 family) [Paenibacillus sp. W2I17]MDT9717959.1 DUF421 domain-containing protein [Paenibacillus sp. ClWae2A]PRA07924.1 hypothetical protein CQ043_11335 [Paenibacillus sp. MYb63]PRA47999.1 hypothetical protein CQ061_15495 [Paenibacillus sp. MYb67]QZN74596.1 DUF421 domain-containing protein [Paenibacillus sp. DR312]
MMEETWVVAVRSIIAFLTLIIYTRVLGKQQMGNLTYFDYINGITIGSIAGTFATDLSSKAWIHFVALTIFTIITIIFQYITLKNRTISKLMDSDPTLIIQNGKILEQNLSKMRVKFDELTMMLRQKDVFDITTLDYAILEPDGSLSVVLKPENQPVTAKDMHMHPPKSKLMTEIIIDGLLIKQNLEERNKDINWLSEQLKKQKITIQDIAFAAILPNDKLYVDLFEDKITEKIDMGDYEGPF